MSAFVNAGKQASPQDSLIPSDEYSAEPTRRGYIEERTEQLLHKRSGSDEDRTPVYQTFAPTPKPPSGEFEISKPKGSATPRKARISLPGKSNNISLLDGAAPKSPKKTIFEKLRITKLTGSTPSPSMASLSSSDNSVVEASGMPVKAQAVLGASRSANTLTRSPSKQKKASFMSRKAAEVSDITTSAKSSTRVSNDTYGGPRTTSSSARTPQTAQTSMSDPTHYSFVNGKRITSQTLSERGAYQDQAANKCAIQRSQSLKYFDPGVPPTPPAKNTPPGQKLQAEASGLAITGRFTTDQVAATPSKARAGVVSTSDRLSPTKFGNYAHKNTPRLVTRPSVYSLHASVVPSVMDATTFEEMKARVDGLGLEGFSMPAETQHRGSPEMMYSPSNYSGEWRNSLASRHGHRLSWNGLPSLAESPGEREPSGHKTNRSASSNASGATIHVYYPDYASDPNVLRAAAARVKDDIESSGRITVHGRTQSRDHSNSPTQSMDMETAYGVKLEGEKVGSGMFALPMHEGRAQAGNASPVSCYHPSAMPSPLHYLPATVYTPPPKPNHRRTNDQTPVPKSKHGAGHYRNDSEMSLIDLPATGDSILDTAPVLKAQPHRPESVSPQVSMAGLRGELGENVDPEKPGYAAGKMDKIINMLNKLMARDESIEAMREEMRIANANLAARLSAVEGLQHSSPSPTSSVFSMDGAASGQDESAVRRESRIPTDVALDFYRHGHSSDRAASKPAGGDAGGEGAPGAEADRIEQFTETNRQLTEMVQGFAAELRAMKEKLGESD
ncbi:hypothetical protein LTR53_015519 [Teratosphaeriaceae sp. CCFEE 6253]|nr:hypothetical protein LTR53_015519 [Teratosphaeriaceae sp. CCFEE 6253]